MVSIIVGPLLVLGAVSNAQDPDSGLDPSIHIVIGVLGVTSIAGGLYLRKRAAETGDIFKRSLAMSPLIVLVLLMARGGILAATRSSGRSSPRTS